MSLKSITTDRKSTRLNSSHVKISYAVCCCRHPCSTLFPSTTLFRSQDPDIGDINAVSADDPVGLYFRQMAQEPLLTAHEEIELAKRIEIGKEARNRLQCPDVTEIYND